MLLSEAIETCFQTRDTWREGSGAKTARINCNHVLRILGDIPIEDIRTVHFNQITTELKKIGRAGGTINRVCAALSTVLNEMKSLGYDLPDVKHKSQKEKKGRPGYFTEDEVNLLLETAAKDKDHFLLHDSILFAFKTGCRQGEMLELTVDNINFEEQEIEFLDTKTGNDHLIKMHDDLVDVLHRRVEASYAGIVFPWANKDQLLRAFKDLKKRCGMEDKDGRVWHTLRHTTATLLCERGVPLRAVMGVLNHSKIETTLRYSKASYRSVADAIDIL
jgi:integrase